MIRRIGYGMLIAFAAMTARATAGEGGAPAVAPGGEKVVKILRTTNKAQVNHYVAKAYEFRNNNPYNVRRFLHKPLAVEEGGIFTYGNPSGEGGVVLMICPEHQIPYYDKLMQVLDVKGMSTADGGNRSYTKVKHRSVADPSFTGALGLYLTTDSFLLTDSETNAVYISDVPSGARTALAALDADLGGPTAQVEVDVIIYEADVSNDGTVGLDFHAWKNGPGRNLFAAGAFNEAEHNRLSNGFPIFNHTGVPLYSSGAQVAGIPAKRFNAHGHNSAFMYDVPSAYFDYLAVQGKARVLAKTRLTMLNTHPGSISVGDQILFHLAQNGAAPAGGTRNFGQRLDPYGDDPAYPDNRTLVGATGDRSVGELEIGEDLIDAVDSGIRLNVTPIIGTDMINLEIDYSVVTVTGFDGEGVPLLSSSTTSQQVRAVDGQELVLGGYSRSADVESTRKVPILGSIPILGYLFGGEINTTKQTVLAITLIPHVVKDFSNMTPDDMSIVKTVDGPADAEMPENSFGWDQYLIGELN